VYTSKPSACTSSGDPCPATATAPVTCLVDASQSCRWARWLASAAPSAMRSSAMSFAFRSTASAASFQVATAAWSAGNAFHRGAFFIAEVIERVRVIFAPSVRFDFRMTGDARSTGFAFSILSFF
jgi:hypothetical protein